MFRFDARHLTAVSSVLKERFPNLTVSETIKITTRILDAIKEAEQPDGQKPEQSTLPLWSEVWLYLCGKCGIVWGTSIQKPNPEGCQCPGCRAEYAHQWVLAYDRDLSRFAIPSSLYPQWIPGTAP